MSDSANTTGTTKTTLRIATRQSPLALWQAEHVAELLKRIGIESELVPLVSGGDVDMSPIDGTRQVGVFTKRIQQALLDDEADVAVHSLKDLPTEVDTRLVLAAVPERETVQDCLVSAGAISIAELPEGSKVGTGSRRRAAQLLSLRPDLRIEGIRGNVQTRLAKLEAGEFDAIMLANAGLVRLEMHELPRYHCSLDEMLPAPGQGALGIEVRCEDAVAIEALSKLDDPDTRLAVTAERRLLAALHGGCLAPIAALASSSKTHLEMTAVVLSPDGQQRLDCRQQVDLADRAVTDRGVSERAVTDRGVAELNPAEDLAAAMSDWFLQRDAETLMGRESGPEAKS